MATLKLNIIANLAGGIWIAGLTLAITPLQVNLLGIETYGLIGFITTLQIIVSVLDFGLSSTITRELASDCSLDRTESRLLLRTALAFYWGIAVLIGGMLFAGADEISRSWFNAATIDYGEITQAFQIVALVLAFRWPVALYTGALAGIHRMDVLNLIKASMATVRLAGGIAVVVLWRNLEAFLFWTAVSALVEVLAYAIICRKVMPEMDWRPGFSFSALQAVWGFSLSMNGLALLGMGITQLDRIMISKMLPLESLGYYSLAYSTATAVSLVLSALSTALMPAYAKAHALKARSVLLQQYDTANRVTLFSTGLVLFTLLFFGEPILRLWVNSEAAAGAWRPLCMLAVGFWLSASVSNAYNAGVACRQPGLLLSISAISAVLYVPVLYSSIHFWGIDGAAASWLLLNFVYVLVIVPTVHRRILHLPVASWYSETLFPFAILGVSSFGCARLISNYFSLPMGYDLIMILPALIVYVGIGYFLVGEIVRTSIIQLCRRLSMTYTRKP